MTSPGSEILAEWLSLWCSEVIKSWWLLMFLLQENRRQTKWCSYYTWIDDWFWHVSWRMRPDVGWCSGLSTALLINWQAGRPGKLLIKPRDFLESEWIMFRVCFRCWLKILKILKMVSVVELREGRQRRWRLWSSRRPCLVLCDKTRIDADHVVEQAETQVMLWKIPPCRTKERVELAFSIESIWFPLTASCCLPCVCSSVSAWRFVSLLLLLHRVEDI